MSLFSDNIRNLRVKAKISQEKLADKLGITRGRYVKYEDGTSEPPYEILKKISFYFHLSIDLLLTVDVRKIHVDDLLKLEDNRILLPIAVDSNGENIIEIIPHKAKAGYLTGYSDPEYIQNLPHISLPFLGSGKHRTFPVTGDSMPPHKDGSFIVAKYVETLGEVVDGKTYIVITRDDGIVYKRLNKNGKNELVLKSDNTFYPPYPVKASDILEIWEYACSISTTEFEPDENGIENVKEMFLELKREIREMKKA